MTTLAGRRILIVEDDFLIASDLAATLESVGAVVLGPTPTIARARALCDSADAAILDVNLRGTLVFPIADLLMRRGVPFVFYTAYGSLDLPARFGGVGRLNKPFRPGDAAQVFPALLGPQPGADPADVERLLPKLRLLARLIVDDGPVSDRLVEATLEEAVERIGSRSALQPLETWLVDLLHQQARTRGGRLMN